MNVITKKVLYMQTIDRNSLEWDDLFTEVHDSVNDLITGVVRYNSRALHGDIHAGYSKAYMLLIRSIEKFEYEGYEFRSFYSRILKNGITDLIRKHNTNKMQVFFDHSLDYTVSPEDGDSFVTYERFKDQNVQTIDTYFEEDQPSIIELLQAFKEVKPIEAGVIELLITYHTDYYTKSDLTAALAAYYGSDTYTSTIQRRVSRAREYFEKFLIKKGYKLFV